MKMRTKIILLAVVAGTLMVGFYSLVLNKCTEYKTSAGIIRVCSGSSVIIDGKTYK